MIILEHIEEPSHVEMWDVNYVTNIVTIYSRCPQNYPSNTKVEYSWIEALINLATLLTEGWYISDNDYDIFSLEEIENVEEEFRKWCELWHGSCIRPCGIRESLRRGDNLANLWSVVKEFDDGWEESFKMFFQNCISLTEE